MSINSRRVIVRPSARSEEKARKWDAMIRKTNLFKTFGLDKNPSSNTGVEVDVKAIV